MRRLWQALRLERALAIGLLLCLWALRVWDPAPVEILRLKTLDVLQQTLPRAAPADSPVVIIDIDEASLKALGQWPWPRTLIAEIVNKLQAAGVKGIAFDVLFAEPDRLSGPALADGLFGADAETRARLRKLPSGEAALAEAMVKSRVSVGEAGYSSPLKGDKTGARAAPLAVIGARPEPFLFTYPGLLRARPEIVAAAAGRGLLSVRPELDGIVRRAPTLDIAEGEMLPSLPIDLLRISADGAPIVVKSDAAGIASVAVAGRQFGTDRNGQILINFSTHQPSRFVSAADVFTGAAPLKKLAGKLAIVGSSATALFDLRATPLDPIMPGVEIDAQIVENILEGSMLSRPSYAIGLEIAAALVLGLLVIIFVPVLGALPVLLAGAAMASSLVLGSWLLFVSNHTLFDVSFPLASSFSLYLLLTYFNYWREEARRTQIRAAFSRYVSPSLVETLVREPGRLKLGGEQREMTILFSDVRNFTTISEGYKSDPQGLVSFMNGLLTPLTNAILERNGTIDKYMGDAILAFWNAPLDEPEHASRACLAALDMHQRLVALNETRKAAAERENKHFNPIEIGIGIGINTGSCVVGNMGSDLRFDYSVLGDSVNIASRLEALTKSYGVGILIGSHTAEAASGVVTTLAIDSIRVKGKTEPETIHVVLGPAAVAGEAWITHARKALDAMRQAYTQGDWGQARHLLDACRDCDPSHRLGKVFDLYATRLDELSSLAAPPQGWDGVYTLTSKEL